jgi:hypothetical protein
MYLPWAFQLYHSRANLIWFVSPFNEYICASVTTYKNSMHNAHIQINSLPFQRGRGVRVGPGVAGSPPTTRVTVTIHPNI